MSYTYKDNTKEVLSALDKAKIRGLKAIGIEAEGFAKEDPNMPVDTGLARNSITSALAGEGARIKSYKADKGDGKGSYSGSFTANYKSIGYACAWNNTKSGSKSGRWFRRNTTIIDRGNYENRESIANHFKAFYVKAPNVYT